MELRWLEAFIAVAEELHFSRAAQRLNLAQSPLSQIIRRLERDLGTPLFDRNTRSVTLTPAGQALLPHARQVLVDVELGRQATRARAGVLHGRIEVGFSGALNHRTLPLLTRAVRQRHPDVTLALTARVTTGDAVDRLERGDLDLAFIGLPIEPSTVRTRVIGRESFAVVLPLDHRLADRASVDLAELADDQFVSMPLGVGSALADIGRQACLDAGFRPRIAQETTDPFMVLTLVSAGVGVALMTSDAAEIVPPGAVLVALTGPPVIIENALAWRADDRSPVLRAVLQVAQEVLPAPR